MLLIIAFALFALLIVSWIVAPGASMVQRREESLPVALSAMNVHSV